jgi:Calpain family cysteine protease
VLLGRKVDWSKPESTKVMEDTLETQHHELFDMKLNSPLYAGMKLANGEAVKMTPDELRILNSNERTTPNLGIIKTLADLSVVGVQDIPNAKVENAFIENGKVSIKLDIPSLNNSLTNATLSKQLMSIAVGAAEGVGAAPGWTPASTHWQDIGEFTKNATVFSDCCQGAVGDCWFISALAAVAWSLPYSIVHRTHAESAADESQHMNQLQFFHKGYGRDGPNDNPILVTDKLLVNNASNSLIYAYSRNAGELWPGIYEKAFAYWSGPEKNDMPNITSLSGGDPALALAQLTGRKPQYFQVQPRTPDALWGLVRSNSASYRTINPMTAWTYASGAQYTWGSGIAANHAYTILGWAWQNNKMYIVLRNPWGFFEPSNGNTYNGVLTFFDVDFWRPINMINNDGVFAIEAATFKNYYAWIGLAV